MIPIDEGTVAQEASSQLVDAGEKSLVAASPAIHLSTAWEKQSDIRSLLYSLYLQSGMDFSDYSPESLKRRILYRMECEKLLSVADLEKRVLNDPVCKDGLIAELCVGTTAMFRDPGFFLAFRRTVVPWLRALPFIRIWHAGCSTGEEVYSMAILMKEEGLYERTRLYATDLNRAFLNKAKTGIFPLEKMKDYTRNYQGSGGRRAFSEYYAAGYDGARFDPSLARNIVFAAHNLVSDPPFNDFDVIFCRNVLIYFNQKLKNHVVELFHRSLAPFGLLGIGDQESIGVGANRELFQIIHCGHRLYQKVRQDNRL